MSPVRNGRFIFNEVPTGYPEPGKHLVYDDSQTIDLDTVPLNGGFLVKILQLSLDPYMRGRMRAPEKESYSPPFTLGQPLHGHGIGRVLRSENSEVKVGDYLYGMLSHVEYEVRPALKGLEVIKKENNLPWSVYLGAAGMPGQTAYMAWKEYSSAKKGEVAFITTGAGPVGSMVIQIAKRDGLKVIASAGSDEKVQFMKDIGADIAFNYKTTNTREVLEKEGPIDIFWDNVGGETLQAALDTAAFGARFILCGAISGYNSAAPPLKNFFNVIGKCIHIFGFLVGRLLPKYKDEFYTAIPPLLASGELKYSEDVTRGLDKAGEAFDDVMRGKNNGKKVIWVADDD